MSKIALLKRDILIGNALREERLRSKLTQQHLADAAGISFQQVQKYESGQNRLSLSTLGAFVANAELDPNPILLAAFNWPA